MQDVENLCIAGRSRPECKITKKIGYSDNSHYICGCISLAEVRYGLSGRGADIIKKRLSTLILDP